MSTYQDLLDKKKAISVTGLGYGTEGLRLCLKSKVLNGRLILKEPKFHLRMGERMILQGEGLGDLQMSDQLSWWA